MNTFENIMENGAFAPKEQILHFYNFLASLKNEGKISKKKFCCNIRFNHLLQAIFRSWHHLSVFRQHEKIKLRLEYFWKYYGKWSICSFTFENILLRILWKMEHLLQKSKCSIFHNIFKCVILGVIKIPFWSVSFIFAECLIRRAFRRLDLLILHKSINYVYQWNALAMKSAVSSTTHIIVGM